MMAANQSWLSVQQGDKPLIVSLPHTGTDIPGDLAGGFLSPWLTLKDTDWHIEKLYGFAEALGATVIRTSISRSVIDVNRDPSGASLYPGQATTELCPTMTFDGEALYRAEQAPDADEIAGRRVAYFDPYHAAISSEIQRLKEQHPNIVLYDCHSIRSVIPRLFDGELPVFNIGTNGGLSAHHGLSAQLQGVCAATGQSHVLNGRFKGGHITRSHGKPGMGVHAVQMELACRAYLLEPEGTPSEANWPSPFDSAYCAPMQSTLRQILKTCVQFAKNRSKIEALK